jgi:uncharacterized protein
VSRAVEFCSRIGLSPAGPASADLGRLVSDDGTLVVLLHARPAFARFTGQQESDLGRCREVIVGLDVDSVEQVDERVEQAVAAGGTSLGAGVDDGFMYMRGFRDPDGHQWTFLHLRARG